MAGHSENTLGGNMANEVLSRVKEVEGIHFDVGLATLLHVEKTRIGSWKNRNTIPYEKLVKYSRDSGVSLDWLLLGQGPQYAPVDNTNHSHNQTIINSDLFITISKSVDQVLFDLSLYIYAEKRDRIVMFIYEELAESPECVINVARIKDIAKLVA